MKRYKAPGMSQASEKNLPPGWVDEDDEQKKKKKKKNKKKKGADGKEDGEKVITFVFICSFTNPPLGCTARSRVYDY